MAMDTSFKSKGSQNNSVSPSQTLGKFAQMALNKNQQDLSEDDIQKLSNKGIKNKEISHVFNEFYQSEDPTKNLNDGAGLGLTIVKDIIEIIRI